jgi:hypothetical protein
MAPGQRMDRVHVFISTGRFRSLDEMRAFVEETYTEDGDGVPSPFMREVELSGYEPGCIECVSRPGRVPLSDLLSGASYADQWLHLVDGSRRADAAICAFAPNMAARPEKSSLEYVGAFPYSHDVWRRIRSDMAGS